MKQVKIGDDVFGKLELMGKSANQFIREQLERGAPTQVHTNMGHPKPVSDEGRVTPCQECESLRTQLKELSARAVLPPAPSSAPCEACSGLEAQNDDLERQLTIARERLKRTEKERSSFELRLRDAERQAAGVLARGDDDFDPIRDN